VTYAVAHPDRLGERALALAAHLGWSWYLTDHEEGRRVLTAVLDAVPLPPSAVDRAPRTLLTARGLALQAASMVGRPNACVVHPHLDCARLAQESLDLLRRADEHRAAALSQVLVAVEGLRGETGQDSLDVLADAEARLPAGSWERAMAAFVRMEVLVRTGSTDDGIAEGDHAAEEFARLGDLWGVSAVRAHQGANLRFVGRPAEAATAYERALTVARRVGLQNTVQLVAAEGGMCRLAIGEVERAEELLQESLAVARRFGYRGGPALVAVGYGYMAGMRGDLETAVARFAEGEELLMAAGSVAYAAFAVNALGHALTRRGDVDQARAAHRRGLEVAALVREPSLSALALEGLAGVAATEGDLERAATLLGAADEHRARRHRPRMPLEAADVDRITADLLSGLGASRFALLVSRADADALLAEEEVRAGVVVGTLARSSSTRVAVAGPAQAGA
jgi:tetratricopeptide (TPR) repeat protein